MAWTWVEKELDVVLNQPPVDLIGVTCLAAGADQLFARAILRHGGSIEAVVPFAGYEKIFSSAADRTEFCRLLSLANRRTELSPTGSQEQAYLEAGKFVVKHSETMVVVWDGKPAAGLGGTGDIVQVAKARGMPIIWIDPVLRKTTSIRD
jgi:hypothetical protein